MRKLLLLLGCFICQHAVFAQQFDADTYRDVLYLAFKAMGKPQGQTTTLSKGDYFKVLSTPETGLVNKAEIFVRKPDNVVVVSLRGTVGDNKSWLENFYAAMIPAAGNMQLSEGNIVPYKFAANGKALVHTGWTLGTLFLYQAYQKTLDSLLNAGHKQLLVTGHSQGGALSFLTTSLLYYTYVDGKNSGISIMNYASAAPKPGNLHYAYDFDNITRSTGAYRIVNANDWVPESPFSIQTLNDYNSPNPFVNAEATFATMKPLQRIALKHVYKQLKKKPAKAVDVYRKYLGSKADDMVQKALPGFAPPSYAESLDYQTAGIPVVLVPDDEYNKRFVFDGKNVFIHHLYEPYKMLIDKAFVKPKP